MTTIIHEYSINLGLAGSGPWLRLISWVYEKKTKQEVNEYIKAKINELIMLFYICPHGDMGTNEDTFCLEIQKRFKPLPRGEYMSCANSFFSMAA